MSQPTRFTGVMSGMFTGITPPHSQEGHPHRHHHHHHHHHHRRNIHFWEQEFTNESNEDSKLPPFYRATLFSDHPDEDGNPQVDPVCGLVLASFGEKDWNGRCRATKQEQEMLFDKFDVDGNGFLNPEEVIGHLDTVRAKVRNVLPVSLHGLLIDDLVRAAFQSSVFDKDQSGDIDRSEWNSFVDELERLYLKFRRQLSFQSERAFYGRGWSQALDDDRESDSGDEEGGAGSTGSVSSESSDAAVAEVELLKKVAREAPSKTPPPMQWGTDKDVTEGFLPTGWVEDLYYYSANHHPVHGIISCDPDHLLSSFERVWMEVATLGFLFIAQDIKAKLRREDEVIILDESHLAKYMLSALISLAGILVYQVLYLLFTCPRLGFVDLSKATEKQVNRAKCCETIGAVIGYLLMSFLAVALLVDIPMLQRRWEPVLLSRLQGYVFTWLFYILFPFNLLFAWGNTSADPESFDKFCLGDCIGIGQWRIEKQRFQMQCKLHKDRGFQELCSTPEAAVVKLMSTASTSSASEHARRQNSSRGGMFQWARPLEPNRGTRRALARRTRAGGGPKGAHRRPRGSTLSLRQWGDVFSQADVAWREYASRLRSESKPDSATA